MYESLRQLVARLLRLPDAPPRAPEGRYRAVEIVRASPRYLRYRLLGVTIGGALALLVFFGVLTAAALSRAPHWSFYVILALLAAPVASFLALAVFLARLDYDLRYYVITDRSLRVREGAWTVKEMTLTYANVQNVRIEQGPLQRVFGISDLVVDTAGGGAGGPGHHSRDTGHRVTLAGLENAPEVRDRVLDHVRMFARSSGLGDLDDPGEGAARRAGRTVSVPPAALDALRDACRSARELRRVLENPSGSTGDPRSG